MPHQPTPAVQPAAAELERLRLDQAQQLRLAEVQLELEQARLERERLVLEQQCMALALERLQLERLQLTAALVTPPGSSTENAAQPEQPYPQTGPVSLDSVQAPAGTTP